MKASLQVLVAEDDEDDVIFLRRALQDAGLSWPLHVVRDGLEAVEYLQQQAQSDRDRLPALALLDIKMPRRSGMDVLEWMRGEAGLRCIPVFMFTSSARRDEVERAYSLGANAFFVKPPSAAERIAIVRLLDAWLTFNQPPLAAVEGLQAARRVAAKGCT